MYTYVGYPAADLDLPQIVRLLIRRVRVRACSCTRTRARRVLARVRFQ